MKRFVKLVNASIIDRCDCRALRQHGLLMLNVYLNRTWLFTFSVGLLNLSWNELKCHIDYPICAILFLISFWKSSPLSFGDEKSSLSRVVFNYLIYQYWGETLLVHQRFRNQKENLRSWQSARGERREQGPALGLSWQWKIQNEAKLHHEGIQCKQQPN